MKQEMIQKRKQVKDLYNKYINLIAQDYFHGYPKLVLQYYNSNTYGSYNSRLNKVSINMTKDLLKIEKTIIHELCHAVNSIAFMRYKGDAHNTMFWRLCRRYGLTPEDYGYGLTHNMILAYAKEKPW